MNIVLVSQPCDIDYFIEIINTTKQYDVVAVVLPPAFHASVKQKNGTFENIEVVENLNDIHADYEQIFLFEGIPDSSKDLIEQVCAIKKNGKKVVEISREYKSVSKKTLKQINIPIITLSKTNPRIKTLKFAHLIQDAFEKDGERVTIASGDGISNILNFCDLAEIMNDDLTIAERIVRINHLVFERIQHDQTQILIVDIPGEISDEYVYIIQQAMQTDYNIVLTEAFRCFDNYYSLMEMDIKNIYYGKVDELIVSEYAMEFLEENCEIALPISEKALKKMCMPRLTVYDIEIIYSKIRKRFTSLQTI